MITFHKTVAGCEAGDRESWRRFLADYTPLMYRLASIYMPSPPEARRDLWLKTLLALQANGCQRLRGFDHQAEREFLVDLRTFLFEQGAGQRQDAPETEAPRPSMETVRALLKALPVLHQQILFLKLAGYSEATLEGMMRATPSIAVQGLERLEAEYGAVLGQERDVCPWPGGWLALLEGARAAKTADCPPLRQFVRVRDGQTGWQEKEPLEKHMAECLHCLERWTALTEIVYWRREAGDCPPEEAEALLAGLATVASRAASKKKSLLKRVLGA